MSQSHYVCSEGCAFEAPLDEVVYRCPKCEGLLQVRHDLAALRSRTAGQWREELERRASARRGPNASGIWRHREWVLPHLPDADIVTLGEGNSPVHELPRFSQRLGLGELLLKQCGIAATGSFKDLGMTVLVSQVKHMRAKGRPLRAVACASTGDTSAALAAYCAASGIPSVVILPRAKISLSQLVQPIANGSIVLSLDTDFDGCMRVVQALTEDSSIYLANSMNSLRLEGQKTVAFEIAHQLGWSAPDWVVIPGGNLGNVTALGMGFELLQELGLIDRLPRIAVAQAQRANPLYRAFKGGFQSLSSIIAESTLASAIQIGNPVSIKRAVRVLQKFQGAVEEATEDELAQASARADLEGAFADPHTGVALAATEKLSRDGTIAPGSRVVVVSTAHGLKFPDFKIRYHEGRLEGVDSRLRNPPVEVAADPTKVRETLARLLDRPSTFR